MEGGPLSLHAALAEMRARVGTETAVGPWLIIDQDRINLFAQATGDTQWIHIDAERAKAHAPHGKTIAHAFLTLALVFYLTEGDDPVKRWPPGTSTVINYGCNRVRFPAAVPVGSRVRARKTLLAAEEIKGALQTVEQYTVEIEGQEKPGCVADILTLYYF
jgi:acyl dehydratase